MSTELVLKLRGISKSFGPTRALDRVDLNIYRHEIHAILGQNGAGKSTLVKILDTVYPDFEGEVYYRGQLVPHREMSEFFKDKLGVVHQEFPLVPHMSVAENLYLSRFPRHGVTRNIKWKELYRMASALLTSLHIHINPRVLVKDLTMGERQLISIARAVSKDPEVLIFDEATSALSDKEVETIFALLRNLTSKGVSVIFISHKLEEIMTIAQRVTVLRDGQSVISKMVADTNKAELIKMMAGRDVSHQFPDALRCAGETALEVEGLTGNNFKDCSFTVRRGEILGVAGLVGSGRPELIKAIFGAEKIESGTIRLHGKTLRIKKPAHAIRNDIYFIPSDRRKEGTFEEMSVRDNTTIGLLKHYCKWGRIDHRREAEVASEFIGKLNIKTTGIRQLVRELSGGNQQKVIISRWLSGKGEVFMFDEPTRGLDVGVKYDVYTLLNQIKGSGKAIIMISSELPELLAMSDRIIVMHEGRIVAHIDNYDGSADQETVLAAMMNEHQKD